MIDTTATRHPDTILSIRQNSIEKESVATLSQLQLKLTGIENKATELRIKSDGMGGLRIKIKPGSDSFVKNFLHGDRYAKEAHGARKYFGLRDHATVDSATKKVTSLSASLIPPNRNFIELRREELQVLHKDLSRLGDDVLLQKDDDGHIRVAPPGTDPKYIHAAQKYFGNDTPPTVRAVKIGIALSLNEIESLATGTQAKLTELSSGDLVELRRGLSRMAPDLGLVTSGKSHLKTTENYDPNSRPAVAAAKLFDTHAPLTANRAGTLAANELSRRDPSYKQNLPVYFNENVEQSTYIAKRMTPTEIREEARQAFGNAMDIPDIKTFFDVALGMAADGQDVGMALVQLALELCEGNFTEPLGRQYVSEALSELPLGEREDLTELVLTVYRQYLAMTSS